MIRWFQRKPQSRQHPSPEQALDALQRSDCMYAPVSTCSGGARSVGLRSDEDANAVLVCGSHYGRLRLLGARELDKLERHLPDAYPPPRQPAPPAPPAEELGPRLVYVNRS